VAKRKWDHGTDRHYLDWRVLHDPV